MPPPPDEPDAYAAARERTTAQLVRDYAGVSSALALAVERGQHTDDRLAPLRAKHAATIIELCRRGILD